MSQEPPSPTSPSAPAPHSDGGTPHYPGYYGSSPYGYTGYSQYGGYQQYGYSGEATAAGRTLRDYVMIVRERAWYLVLAIFVFTVGALLWNQSKVAEYAALARFQVLRKVVTVVNRSGGSGDERTIVDDRDFNSQVTAMNSFKIIAEVQKRLTVPEQQELLEPYKGGNILAGQLSYEEIIAHCRTIEAERQTFIVKVQYRHPKRELAIKVANYFVDVIKQANSEGSIALVDPLVDKLRTQLDQKRVDIENKRTKRSELIEKNRGVLGMTDAMRVAPAEMSGVSARMEQDKQTLEELSISRKAMLDAQEKGESIASNPFISRDTAVMSQMADVSKFEVQLRTNLKTLTEKHPLVIELTQQLATAKEELNKALAEAVAKLNAAFKTAESNYEASKKRYEAKQTELMGMATAFNEWETLTHDLHGMEQLYYNLSEQYEAKRVETYSSATPMILVDPASSSETPVNKSILLALVIGLGLGLVVGLALVVLLSALDDRVKSSADVEYFVGVPLLGVIPKIAKLDSFMKARSVATNADRASTEAFHSIYSALKIHGQAGKAKAMLTTSTTPSEGKSFFTTNLAMTYALHGERVIVVDADLRIPNVGRSLKLEGDDGITKYQAGLITLDQAIRQNIVPNMDVLPVGAACKNPTQVLNSKKFAMMIEELKGRYDRVFIDSPPVGAVSDALNLMPHVDGALYVVKFNTVHRKSIKANMRRLLESKVPVYGAVLNQIGLRVANHYTNSYDKSYNKYYHDSDPNAVEVKVEN